jgi:hypothetical protein
MRTTITQGDLRVADRTGVWTLERDALFYLRRYHDTDQLKGPGMVLKAGTHVHVEKVYRRGRAALLCYIDRTGKVWWSWTHATEYEQSQVIPQT